MPLLTRDSDAGYTKRIEADRRSKDRYFKESPHSPLVPALREEFEGLAYYPPNSAFRVKVRLQRYPSPEKVTLATSQGVPREMLKHGFFEFAFGGQSRRLHAYKSLGHTHGEETLFVPFRDATSGKQTYGAARYLDLPVRSDDAYEVDFNLAYNPTCAYNDGYVCPFPPRENWLDIPVEAGEKNFPLAELREQQSREGGHAHAH